LFLQQFASTLTLLNQLRLNATAIARTAQFQQTRTVANSQSPSCNIFKHEKYRA